MADYTREQLMSALRKADAAGDVEAARAIARRVKALETEAPSRFSASASGTAKKAPPESVISTLGRSTKNTAGGMLAGAAAGFDMAYNTSPLNVAMAAGSKARGVLTSAITGRKDTSPSFTSMVLGQNAPSQASQAINKLIPPERDMMDARQVSEFVGGAMVPSPKQPTSFLAPQLTGPAAKLASAKKFGMDIAIGDARGRGAKVIERTLDAMPGSAGVMQEARDVLADKAVRAVDDVAGSFGPQTSFRGMGQAAQKGARNWIARFIGEDSVTSKAYSRIPIKPDTPATTAETQRMLADLANPTPSNELLSKALANPRFERYLTALRGTTEDISTGLLDEAGNPVMRQVTKGGTLGWRDLMRFRSEIGEELGDAMIVRDARSKQLSALYSTLSRDMEATARAQGGQAWRKFNYANDLYRAGMQRIDDALTPFLGKADDADPEKAARLVQTVAMEGRSNSNLRLLQEIRSSLRPAEWGEVANGFIRLLGQPANAAGRDFDPGVFMRNFNDMAPESKNLLFGKGALRQNLDELSGVMGDLAASGGTRNTSNTGMIVGGMATITAPVAAMASGDPLLSIGTMAAQLGAQYKIAKLWTDPKVIKAATGYTRAMKAGAKQSEISGRERLLEAAIKGSIGAGAGQAEE